jgi:beta-glucanase (GH16 family)
MTAGPMKYNDGGAQFTVSARGDSPTIQSNFYIFFGTVSVIMQAAKGQGIISSIVLESDDLDEVDWEIIGGNTTHVETNYFGKGNTTSFDRAIYYPVTRAPQDGYTNYTIVWTKEKLEWWIDANLVRTLPYGEANGGHNYPQTPMNIRLGIWAGGDPKNPNGTIEWAGGLTTYGKESYNMFVKTVDVQDFSTGKSYTYGDHSGSWQSIKIES